MANLQHDSEGFLNGENANLDKQTQLLQSISKDIADIKKSFTSNSAKNGQGKQSGKKVDSAGNSNKNRTTVNNSTAATSQSRHRSESINRNNAQSSNQQRQQNHAGRVQLGTLDNSSSSSSNQNSIQNRVTYEPTQQTSERQRETTETSGNIGANNNDANNRNSSNRAQSSVLQPTRNRDENGRFIGGNQGGRTQTVSEPRENATAGRDANGRFSSGESGGLGKGRGGEAGFISRLASGIGGVVGATKDEVTDEKIDPFIGAMKEVAEPLKKVGGAALKVGSVLFGGAKKAVDFLPKFKKKGAKNTQSQSPASREVRTPPARIDETTTANPILRARDSRGRFISSQSVSQPSTRQTGSDFSQNNLSQRNAIEPSRNTIIGTNTSQSPSDSEQVSQSEPPVAGTSRRSFFGRGGNLGRKPKGEKLSLRGAIKEIITSRKEQTIYNKASLKLLKVIANKETSSGSSDSGGGFFSGLMGGLIPMAIAGIGALVAGVVGVFTGIGGLLLTGVTGALGVIFSPIGLAIAAAGALAWGLFTDDGHKFFASIGEYISGGWDKATGFITENFGGVIDTATQFWADLSDSFAPITKVAGDLFDGLTTTWKGITDTISNIFDAFSTFLKDKFGIDIPAAVKTVTEPVVAAADAVVTQAKDAGNKIAEGAKEKATQAVEATKAVVNPAYEGVKKSVKDGTVLKDTGQAISNSASVAGGVIGGVKDVITGKSSDRKNALITEMDSQGITDKKERAMLMAQADVESGGFKYGKELGNDAYFDKYDAGTKIGKNLGNTEKGDGAKYKGRGSIQLTGRANYTAASKDLGVDLVNHPELAEAPEMAAKTALWFWKKNKKISTAAKEGDVTSVTHKVNGGENGLAERKDKYAKYLAQANNGELDAKPTDTETTLAKLSPISTAAASEAPANGGKVAPEITAQNKGGKDYFLGDSIAHGYRGKGEGDTVVGRNPAKILESMQANLAENPDFYKGKNVHLSTGMSNNTGDTKSIEAQMKLLKDSGANSSVYGVSNNFKGDTSHATTMNKTLSDLSAKYGANFTGGFEASKDTVHPKSYSKDQSKNAEAQKSVDAGLKPEVLAQANAPIMTHESLPMLSSDGTGLTHSTTHKIKFNNDTDMKGNKTKPHVETPEEKEKAYTDARWAQTNSYSNGDHNSTDPAVKANFEALKAKADKLDPEYVAPDKIPNKSRFETNKSGTIEEDIANTDKYWAADIAEADAQSVSTYNGQIVQKPQAESFSEANAPAISNYSKTGKMAKTEAVAPIESPVIEPVEPPESDAYKSYNADKKGMAGYMMKDNGEGGMTKINLETLKKTIATPEEISSYKTGSANPTELATKEPPPEKASGATVFGDSGSATTESPSLFTSSSNKPLSSSGNVTTEYVDSTQARKDELLSAPNTAQDDALINAELARQQSSDYLPSAVTTNETVAAPSIETPASTTVPPAKNSRIPKIELASRNKPKDDAVNVENEPPLIADIKSRMPALPEFATNAISGMTSGGIGSSLSGGMPSFMKDATSTISKSISMPSLPKMPSMPAIADAPAVKEPLGSNESRQNGAVSQPTADIGQNMSDSRLAHICSGGYSRG